MGIQSTFENHVAFTFSLEKQQKSDWSKLVQRKIVTFFESLCLETNSKICKPKNVFYRS